jgi:4-oxalocrotonate tautomerase
LPLVRIDLRKGKNATYREAIGSVVHEPLLGVGVPKDDRFQVFNEHEQSNFIFNSEYLGIRRNADLVIIQLDRVERRPHDRPEKSAVQGHRRLPCGKAQLTP